MPRTLETTVYKFSELSDRAKEKARDWFRGSIQSDWQADSVIEDGARLAAIIGINLHTRPVKLIGGGIRNEPNVYWSIGDRGEGLTFAGSYSYAKGSVKALESEAPSTWKDKTNGTMENESNKEINAVCRTLAEVQRKNFYRVQAYVSHGVSRNYVLSVDVERSDSVSLSFEDCETVTQCMRDFCNWLHRVRVGYWLSQHRWRWI